MRVKLLALCSQKIWRPTHTLVETVGVFVRGVHAHVGRDLCLGARVAGDTALRRNGHCGYIVRSRGVIASFTAGSVVVSAPTAISSLHRSRPLGIERHGYLLKVVAAVAVSHGTKKDIFR